jgi:hypothetical protein
MTDSAMKKIPKTAGITRISRTLAAAALAIALTGCATDVANRYYASRTYPPKNPSQVEVLRREPGRPYEAIADFQSRWDTPDALREKAAKIGADAIIIVQPGGRYNTTQQWAGQDSLAGSSPRICGTAIIYK